MIELRNKIEKARLLLKKIKVSDGIDDTKFYEVEDLLLGAQRDAKGENELAILFVDWIADQKVENRIMLVDGDWYFEADNEGDNPMTTEELYKIFILSRNI